jgi:intraflagellar transport protein 172
MKLKHDKSLLFPEEKLSLSRIECLCFSPNLSRIAICTSINNQIVLFDANSNDDKSDKFALKPMAKNFSRKSFIVKGIAFSPDSQKLAIGQSDCVIFVYKIGQNW